MFFKILRRHGPPIATQDEDYEYLPEAPSDAVWRCGGADAEGEWVSGTVPPSDQFSLMDYISGSSRRISSELSEPTSVAKSNALAAPVIQSEFSHNYDESIAHMQANTDSDKKSCNLQAEVKTELKNL